MDNGIFSKKLKLLQKSLIELKNNNKQCTILKEIYQNLMASKVLPVIAQTKIERNLGVSCEKF